jgi:hypothetical protein
LKKEKPSPLNGGGFFISGNLVVGVGYLLSVISNRFNGYRLFEDTPITDYPFNLYNTGLLGLASNSKLAI